MRRSAVEPMWPEPAGDFFRCRRCRIVVPDTRMSDAEAERRRLNGRDMVCDACLSPAPVNASRDRCREAGDDAPTHTAGAGLKSWDEGLQVTEAGFVWEGE